MVSQKDSNMLYYFPFLHSSITKLLKYKVIYAFQNGK